MILYILANPQAGRHGAEHIISEIQQSYPQLKTKVYLTSGLDDEKNQIEAILEIFTAEDRFLILGGDGTLSKSLAFWPVHLPFAYYPTGSGNDFAKSMAIHKLEHVLEAILADKQKSIFVLHSCLGVVMNTMDIGFVSQVIAHATNSNLKSFLNSIKLGKLTYLIFAIRSLLSHQSFDVRLEVDGKSHKVENLFFFSIVNNTYFGGGIMIWPEAKATQEGMDIVYIKNGPLHRRILALLDLLLKRHKQSSHLHHLAGKNTTVSLDQLTLIQLDGEMSSAQKLTLICQERFIYQ
ncbi:hypothetical protein EII38_07665 [Streptococcus minor]|uniref:DAGKc domain-containing protein n=1 Tax=Streptococcus minor TaxID=229549 RepID=A0A3P1V8J3_9STRE|nr:diacylglycerol kinase family protein [Streptococcus minor]RRD30479.1 hypothetical protein EII38_07665 [Streptococcus minor]